MKRLWSPWRSQYIESFAKPARRRAGETLFTAALKARRDDENLIVWRGRRCFVMMNRYPYNSGHLMIIPNRRRGHLEDMTQAELSDVMEAVKRAKKALDAVMQPQGYNFGANLGRVGGAGIDDHIHFHLVPRWNGDTNFMPVLSETKVISEEITETMRKLRKHFKA
jgi:ATP adenylyltransferase